MNSHQSGHDWALAQLDELAQEDEAFELLLAAESLTDSGSKGVLVCEGDSWFDYHPLQNKDILKWLRKKHGYDVREAGPKYGDTLQDMSDHPGQLCAVKDCLQELKDEGEEPRALLLSAGGNDIATKETLSGLLNYKRTGAPILKQVEVDHFIFVRLKNALLHWIGAMDATCERLFGKQIPIFVHGYAKPVPDGDAFGWDWVGVFPGPWLKPAFVRKGYWGSERNPISKAEALAETTPAIGELIDKFNEMLASVESELGHMHHINLRDVLTNALPNGYKDDWANELHPKKEGFKRVAQRVSETLEAKLT